MHCFYLIESEKRCHLDVPSPCQGDAEAEPDKPEATAIGVRGAYNHNRKSINESCKVFRGVQVLEGVKGSIIQSIKISLFHNVYINTRNRVKYTKNSLWHKI